MQYNAREVEDKTKERWERDNVPKKIVNRKEGEKFYLLDGPPYVNAPAHAGHIKMTTYKDVWGKFKFMQGYKVWFQPGFDCGGLPIENKVETQFKIKNKEDIKKLGIDKFISECKLFAESNKDNWMNLYKNIGAWRGYVVPYLTSDNSYKESGWWAIKQIYDKGLLVQGEKPSYWCPRCETILSGYEVTDSYTDLQSPSIFVKFKLKEREEYLLVWTTTPWTLPANVALCLHPEETYVEASINGEKLILAKERLLFLDELGIKYEILSEFLGRELEGTKYEPLLDIQLQQELSNIDNAHRIVSSIQIMKKRVASKLKAKKGVEGEDEFGHIVDITTGTGIVHIAPGHGLEDSKVGEHYNLPNPSPVDEKGRLTDSVGAFSGKTTIEANKEILDYLDKKSLLFYSTTFVHSSPVCWRCKTPLIYRMSKQWFLKLDLIRDKILKEVKSVKWCPEFTEEQFENIIQSAPDWPITRQRYWGIPLPVWVCEKCNSIKVIGSRKELIDNSNTDIDEDFDISVSDVDKIKLKCNCKGEMRRVEDILDVWFDSGISPFASLGYPVKNEGLFKELWPVDLIDESQDQIRGWFYSLMVLGVAIFDKTPYKKVAVNGWTLDEKGEKMSKSLGNVIWANKAYEELGADILRFYVCSSNAPWETSKFSLKEAKILNNTMNTLCNLVTFAEAYSKEDFNCSLEDYTELSDRWIISRINTLINEITLDIEEFRFHHATRKITEFIVNDFSRIYIKLVRARAESKEVASVMRYLFDRVLILLAPFCPFISDELYNKLFLSSIHLQTWHVEEKNKIDEKLEKSFELAKEISEAINSERQKQGIGLRYPIRKATIFGSSEIEKYLEDSREVTKVLSNTKEIIFERTEKAEIKPNFASLGKKFGEKTKEVAAMISKIRYSDLKDKMKIGEFELEKEDLIVKYVGEGSTSFSKGYVILDLEEDKELKQDRFLRTLTREIQKARQADKLWVQDKIILFLEEKDFVKKFESELTDEVKADKIFYRLEKEKGIAKYKDLEIKFGFKRAE